jgi:hypothetical protein
MAFWDDLQKQATESLQNSVVDFATTGINSFIKNQQMQTPPLVRVGPTPTGNLSAAQIAAGMTAQQQPIAAPQAAGGDISRAAGETASALKPYLPFILLAGAGAYFFFKRSK